MTLAYVADTEATRPRPAVRHTSTSSLATFAEWRKCPRLKPISCTLYFCVSMSRIVFICHNFSSNFIRDALSQVLPLTAWSSVSQSQRGPFAALPQASPQLLLPPDFAPQSSSEQHKCHNFAAVSLTPPCAPPRSEPSTTPSYSCAARARFLLRNAIYSPRRLDMAPSSQREKNTGW